MRLQLLDLLGHRRRGDVEQIGSTGEGAGFDDADKGAHGAELVHGFLSQVASSIVSIWK